MKRNKQGFTLIELLVVMAIIAILASIVVPNIVGWIGRARMTRAHSEIKGIELALAKMLTDTGRNSLHELFSPEAVQARMENSLGGGAWVGGQPGLFTAEAFRRVKNLYTEATYVLLREGRRALQDNQYADVYRRDVVRNLSEHYMDVGFDPWGNLYNIYPAPWPFSQHFNPVPFRTFARREGSGNPLPGSDTRGRRADGISWQNVPPVIQQELQETTIGYPAPRRPNVAYIWSAGANMISGQAMYAGATSATDLDAAYDTDYPPNNYLPQEEIFMFGGDDINNWDNENSWSRFYE